MKIMLTKEDLIDLRIEHEKEDYQDAQISEDEKVDDEYRIDCESVKNDWRW